MSKERGNAGEDSGVASSGTRGKADTDDVQNKGNVLVGGGGGGGDGAAAADTFEQEHVHDVYSAIAPHFSSTRFKAWPKVREFVESLPPGSTMIDVGCGNGKNLCLSDTVFAIGCDRCENLVKIVQGQRFEGVVCDGLQTAFRPGAFDAAISIAVIHHFATPERRAQAVVELMRLVRVGGRGLVYVWAKEQPKMAKKHGDEADVLVKWEMHDKFDASRATYQRYYHLFVKGELEDCCAQASAMASSSAAAGPSATGDDGRRQKKQDDLFEIVVERSYFDKENWCAVLVKKEKGSDHPPISTPK